MEHAREHSAVLSVCKLFSSIGITPSLVLTFNQVLGGSFLYASFGRDKETFNKTRTGVMSALVMVVSACLVIPTIMSVTDKASRAKDGLGLSHDTSIVLFLLFVSYVVFRFRTHPQVFSRNQQGTAPTTDWPSLQHELAEDAPGPLAQGLSFVGAVACSAVCANYLIRNMEAATRDMHMTKAFAGLVLLPVTGNLAKSINIIRNARHDGALPAARISKLDFAIRSIMTNILDTLLFILPLSVLLGWALSKPMTLRFELFDAVVFLLSIVVITYLIQHGKTTYFEGFMLMGT